MGHQATIEHISRGSKASRIASRKFNLIMGTQFQVSNFRMKRGSACQRGAAAGVGRAGPWPADHKTQTTLALRVQVPNYKISTPNHNHDSQHGNPTHPTVRYFGPFGLMPTVKAGACWLEDSQ